MQRKNVRMKVIYLDIETTGLACPQSGLVQVAGIIEIDGEEKERFNLHAAPFPQDAIDDQALAVNGISRDALVAYPHPSKIFNQFVEILSRYVDRYDKSDKFHVVAYNAKYDTEHLRAWFEKNKDKFYGSWFWHPPLDVMTLAAAVLAPARAGLTDFKLATVARFVGLTVDENRAHDAVYDVELTRQLFQWVTKHISSSGAPGPRPA